MSEKMTDEEKKKEFDEFYAMYPTESLEVGTDEITLTMNVSEFSPDAVFTSIVTVQMGKEKKLIRLVEDKPFKIRLKK